MPARLTQRSFEQKAATRLAAKRTQENQFLAPHDLHAPGAAHADFDAHDAQVTANFCTDHLLLHSVGWRLLRPTILSLTPSSTPAPLNGWNSGWFSASTSCSHRDQHQTFFGSYKGVPPPKIWVVVRYCPHDLFGCSCPNAAMLQECPCVHTSKLQVTSVALSNEPSTFVSGNAVRTGANLPQTHQRCRAMG